MRRLISCILSTTLLRHCYSLSIAAQTPKGDGLKISRGLKSCIDSSGQVLVQGVNRTCKYLVNNNMTDVCDDSSEIGDFCSRTCDTCSDEEEIDEGCINSKGKILVQGVNRTCKYLVNNNMTDVCDDSSEIRDFCPLTCNICGGVEDCVNSKGKILVQGVNRTCKALVNNNMTHVCDDSSEIRGFCPLTCNICKGVEDCSNSKGKILVQGSNRTCKYLVSNHITHVCDDSSEIRDFCPLACGICAAAQTTDGSCVNSRGKVLVGERNRTCNFISENSMASVCDDSITIRDFCPLTCGNCDVGTRTKSVSIKIGPEVNHIMTAVVSFYLAMVTW